MATEGARMKKVLVIDDEEQVRTWLREVLEWAGYEVDEADNGLAGLARMDQNLPDLVITDLYMPEKEGMETIRELRLRFPHVRVIAVSGGSIMVQPFNALTIANHMGAHRILAKPFSMKDLLLAVRELLHEPTEPVS